MSKGIRVIAVINRKGGCGKSTLVRGLASAAIVRGERVTIFDTDSSKGCYGWMMAAKQLGNWNDRADVIHTFDPDEITATIEAINAEPAHDHLVLIDTYGGASEALDDVVLQSDLVVAPIRPGRNDFTETMETLIWHERLKGRVRNPDGVPEYRVVINGVSAEPSAIERETIQEILASMPVIEEPIMERKAYKQVDGEGLLGAIRDNTRKGIVQNHLTNALDEMDAVLELLDEVMLSDAEAVE
ncbi:nucleotide-binding protein [Paracoccus sp. 22332]|uniref:nucleotide-binding protein n=1 Tax=Paracoccus sp. 22332 TaxID=3453913 RepID=UPI003F8280D4